MQYRALAQANKHNDNRASFIVKESQTGIEVIAV